jgi:hypothetical protein
VRKISLIVLNKETPNMYKYRIGMGVLVAPICLVVIHTRKIGNFLDLKCKILKKIHGSQIKKPKFRKFSSNFKVVSPRNLFHQIQIPRKKIMGIIFDV